MIRKAQTFPFSYTSQLLLGEVRKALFAKWVDNNWLFREPNKMYRHRTTTDLFPRTETPCTRKVFAMPTATQTSVFVTLVIYKGKLFSPRLGIQVPLHGMENQLTSTGISARHKATGQCLPWPCLTIQAVNLRLMAWWTAYTSCLSWTQMLSQNVKLTATNLPHQHCYHCKNTLI